MRAALWWKCLVTLRLCEHVVWVWWQTLAECYFSSVDLSSAFWRTTVAWVIWDISSSIILNSLSSSSVFTARAVVFTSSSSGFPFGFALILGVSFWTCSWRTPVGSGSGSLCRFCITKWSSKAIDVRMISHPIENTIAAIVQYGIAHCVLNWRP